MAVLATDDFDRADGGLGANWTTLAAHDPIVIVSNAATYTSSGNDAASRYSAISWPNDQYGVITVEVQSGGQGSEAGIGLILRFVDVNNFYRIVVNGGLATQQVTVAKVASSSYSVITTRDQVFTTGDTFYAEIQGTTIKVVRNGVQLGADITDSSMASGDVGLYYSSSALNARAADFEGGDFAAAGTGLAWIKG